MPSVFPHPIGLVRHMQITETANEGLTRKFQVVIGAEDIGRRMNDRLGELARTVKLAGFRPGKVPMSVVRQRFGQSVMGEVLEKTVTESSSEAIKERNLRPALQPKIQISSFEDGKDLVYDVELEVLPDVSLPDLSAIKLERLMPQIDEAEIEEQLTRLADRFRKADAVEDGVAAETGDLLTVDYVGTIDGERFAGGSAEGTVLELGSGRFIPGFEEQLVGAKAGDTPTIDVTFPEEYGAEHLAGKRAQFAVTVHAVKRKAPAVIDETLAENLGLESLEELRGELRKEAEKRYGEMGRLRAKRDLLDQLAEAHKFEVPKGMVDIEFDAIWRQYEAERDRARSAGTYKPEEDSPEETVKAEYRGIAERRVRLGLLLAEIGKTANIQISQEEVTQAVVAEARQYPGQEKAIFDYYREHPEALQNLRAPIYEEKVVDHIFEVAEVTVKSLPTGEFLKAAQLDDEDEDEAAAPAA